AGEGWISGEMTDGGWRMSDDGRLSGCGILCGFVASAFRRKADQQRPHQAHLERSEQPALEAAVTLTAGDQIDHDVADRRAAVERVHQESGEARAEERVLDPRRAAQLVVDGVADGVLVLARRIARGERGRRRGSGAEREVNA